MKNILIITSLLFYSFSLSGQENEHLFFLETDTSWRKEMFIFRCDFLVDFIDGFQGTLILRVRQCMYIWARGQVGAHVGRWTSRLRCHIVVANHTDTIGNDSRLAVENSGNSTKQVAGYMQ